MSLTKVTDDVSGVTVLKDSAGVIQAYIDGAGDLIVEGTVKVDGGAVTLTGALVYKGTHDASTLAYPATPATGDYYRISVAGTISGTAYKINDAIIYNGATWDKSDNTEDAESLAANITAVAAKNPPIDADEFALTDSADSFSLKKLTWAVMKSTMKTHMDTYYDDYQNFVLVKSTADLPTSVAGERTFAANTVYAFNASMSDADTWILGDNTKFLGVNGITETITYTGSGIFLKSTDCRVMLDDMSFYTAGAGTLFQYNNTAATKYLTAYSTNFIGGAKGIEVNGCAIIQIEKCGIMNSTSKGIELNGNVGVAAVVYNLFQQTGTAGTAIDISGISSNQTDILRVSNNQWVPSHANHNFLNIVNENFFKTTGSGIVSQNIPQNALGTFLSGGLTVPTTNRIQFTDNPTLTKSHAESLAYLTAAATTTIADLVNYVVLAGTWTSGVSSRFTLQTSPNKFTYNGYPKTDVYFFATIKLDLVGAGTNRLYTIGLRKNGITLITHSLQNISIDTGNPLNIPILASLTDVVTNDYFEVVILATSNVQDIQATGGTISFLGH